MYLPDKLDCMLFRKIQIDCTQTKTADLTLAHYELDCAFLQLDLQFLSEV